MRYLIDGHNLIAHLPGIDLEDPNDEVKLVLVLRSWAAARSLGAAGQKRRATLYFDGGLPGGKQADLSGGGIEVVFSSAGYEADNLLIRRIKQVRNPREYTLVTSDRQIIAAAQKRKMPVISSNVFAGRLTQEREQRQAAVKPAAGDDPIVTAAEVTEWLELFGPVPERTAPRKQPVSQKKTPPKKEKKRPAGELKTDGSLSEEDVDAWLDLFGGEPKPPPSPKPQTPAKKKRAAGDPKTTGTLSDEDLAAWLEYFGSDSG